MPIKAIIAKLDDVDEKYRDLYVEKGEGKEKKWHLQVEGVRTQADVENLQRGNKLERDNHAKTKADLAAATAKLEAFGELDPEVVTASLEELDTLKKAGPNMTAEQIKTMVDLATANNLKKETAKIQKQLDEANKLNGTLTTERDALAGQGVQRTIDDAVRHAATTAKVLDTAVPDALMHARGTFKIVEGKVQTEDGQSPDEWLEARKGVAGHWWPTTQGAGARGNVSDLQVAGGTNPFTREAWNVTKQGEVLKGDPTRAARLAEVAGVPKNDRGEFIWGQMPAKAAA